MVNGVDATAGQGQPYAATTVSGPGGELGRDAFLQLLVTQLRYQDPINPLEARDMVAQLAQFSSLEQLQAMGEGLSALSLGLESLNLGSARLEAMSLLGRAVRLSDGTVGLVQSLRLADVLPQLILEDGTTFALEDVAEVLKEVPIP